MQMFGHFEDGVWKKGIIANIFGDAHNMARAAEVAAKESSMKRDAHQTLVRKWLVLDGDLHPDWVDNMTSLLDTSRSLSLSSGEQIQLHGD